MCDTLQLIYCLSAFSFSTVLRLVLEATSGARSMARPTPWLMHVNAHDAQYYELWSSHLCFLRRAMQLKYHSATNHNAPIYYLQILLAKSFQGSTSPSTHTHKGFLRQKLAQHVRLRRRRRKRLSRRVRLRRRLSRRLSLQQMIRKETRRHEPSTRRRRRPLCRSFSGSDLFIKLNSMLQPFMQSG